jgi:hypothetical protein
VYGLPCVLPRTHTLLQLIADSGDYDLVNTLDYL